MSTHDSLRHDEARDRAALLDVSSYDVALDLRPGADPASYTSVTTIDVHSRGGPTWLDVRPRELRSISLDGAALDPARLARGRYPLDLSDGEHRLVVEAAMPYRNDGEGLHRSTDAADGRDYVYAMSFMDAAPTIFACFDQPDLKAPYTLHVTAPEDWTVVANGSATRVAPGVWEMATTPPLSTYVVTLIGGPWHVLRHEHDGIALGISARASIAEHLDAEADELFDVTRRSFDELHRLFGIRYPFGDYHQAFVPEFNAGAMENPGCVTFRDPLVFTTRVTRGQRLERATTIAHEMAHQWFGNLVTPRWWDDLWLNESFAEYLGNRVIADVTLPGDPWDDAWTGVAWTRRPWGLDADQRRSTHPVAGNGAVDAESALQDFDGISYAKGSALLGQLATVLGDDAFFGGAIDLMGSHRFANASMAELFTAWERASGRDLSGFTSQWLRTAGPDLVALDRAAQVVRRTPPAEHPAEREHQLGLAVERDGALVVEPEPLVVQGDRTPYDGGSGAVVLDPHAATWAATVLDEQTVAALPRLLPSVVDPLLRASIWGALRTTLRRGMVDPAAVLEVVDAACPVHDTLGSTATWILGELLPLAPDGAAARVHVAALTAADAAGPGSEQQLAGLRLAVSTAGDDEVLERWASGELPDGVSLDQNLRWRILVQLAGLGATDRDRLDADLADHRDAEAVVAHARAIAALPEAEAKAAAWRRFTGEDLVANYELQATGLGFWRAGQEALTAPYVERYVADLPGTAAVRSGWVLGLTADDFFPRTALDADTLSRVRTLADDPALAASLRRRLADQADNLTWRLDVLARYPRGAR